MKFFIIIGLVLIFISGISIGAWSDVHRERKNFSEVKRSNNTFGLYAGLAGLVSLGIGILLYFLK